MKEAMVERLVEAVKGIAGEGYVYSEYGAEIECTD